MWHFFLIILFVAFVVRSFAGEVIATQMNFNASTQSASASATVGDSGDKKVKLKDTTKHACHEALVTASDSGSNRSDNETTKSTCASCDACHLSAVIGDPSAATSVAPTEANSALLEVRWVSAQLASPKSHPSFSFYATGTSACS